MHKIRRIPHLSNYTILEEIVNFFENKNNLNDFDGRVEVSIGEFHPYIKHSYTQLLKKIDTDEDLKRIKWLISDTTRLKDEIITLICTLRNLEFKYNELNTQNQRLEEHYQHELRITDQYRTVRDDLKRNKYKLCESIVCFYKESYYINNPKYSSIKCRLTTAGKWISCIIGASEELKEQIQELIEESEDYEPELKLLLEEYLNLKNEIKSLKNHIDLLITRSNDLGRYLKNVVDQRDALLEEIAELRKDNKKLYEISVYNRISDLFKLMLQKVVYDNKDRFIKDQDYKIDYGFELTERFMKKLGEEYRKAHSYDTYHIVCKLNEMGGLYKKLLELFKKEGVEPTFLIELVEMKSKRNKDMHAKLPKVSEYNFLYKIRHMEHELTCGWKEYDKAKAEKIFEYLLRNNSEITDIKWASNH